MGGGIYRDRYGRASEDHFRVVIFFCTRTRVYYSTYSESEQKGKFRCFSLPLFCLLFRAGLGVSLVVPHLESDALAPPAIPLLQSPNGDVGNCRLRAYKREFYAESSS